MTKQQLIEQAFFKSLGIGKDNAIVNRRLKIKAHYTAINLKYDTEIIDTILSLSEKQVREIMHSIYTNIAYEDVCGCSRGYYIAETLNESISHDKTLLKEIRSRQEIRRVKKAKQIKQWGDRV